MTTQHTPEPLLDLDEFRDLADSGANQRPLDAAAVLRGAKAARGRRRAAAIGVTALVAASAVVGFQVVRPHTVGVPAQTPSVSVSASSSRASSSAAAFCKVNWPVGAPTWSQYAGNGKFVVALTPDGHSAVTWAFSGGRSTVTWASKAVGGQNHTIWTNTGDVDIQAQTDGRWVALFIVNAQNLVFPGDIYVWDSSHPQTAPVRVGHTDTSNGSPFALRDGRLAYRLVSGTTSTVHVRDLAASRDRAVSSVKLPSLSAAADSRLDPMLWDQGLAWAAIEGDRVRLRAESLAGTAVALPSGWGGSYQVAAIGGDHFVGQEASGAVVAIDGRGRRTQIAASSPGAQWTFDGRHLLVYDDTTYGPARLFDLVSASWALAPAKDLVGMGNGWVWGVSTGVAASSDLPGC